MAFLPSYGTGLLVRSTSPTAADTPDSLAAAGYAVVVVTRQGMEVRLQVVASAAAPVAVRPWIYLGGVWMPLRTDGVSGVGTETVTADKTLYGGFASGVYLSGPMGVAVCLVAEAGAPADVATASVSEYFVRTS